MNFKRLIFFFLILAIAPHINAEELSVQKLLIVPRIKLTEKNSLKSYEWWNSPKPKISKIYKQILKKIKQDFLLESFEIDYQIKTIGKENMNLFEGYFVLLGNLVIDSKNKQFHELIDLSLFEIKNGTMNLVGIASQEILNSRSSFRSFAKSLNEKATNAALPEVNTKPKYLNSTDAGIYFVVFENELSYNELKQIKEKMQKILGIGKEDVSLLFSESKKYTFQLKSSKNPEPILVKEAFVKGPYQTFMNENTLVFKTIAPEEDPDENL